MARKSKAGEKTARSLTINETNLLKLIQLEASKLGHRMFRNNCGNLQNNKGQWVKYGVANPGGSDLIGWKPVVITPDMVGKTVAIFTALEIKSGNGILKTEQRNFLNAVNAGGGDGNIHASRCNIV